MLMFAVRQLISPAFLTLFAKTYGITFRIVNRLSQDIIDHLSRNLHTGERVL